MSDLPSPPSRPPVRKSVAWRRVVPLVAVAVVAVLGIAWIDGGERALRPIAEEIELPPARPAPVPELVPVGGEG